MHKIVNGQEVPLTPEEEIAIQEEWSLNYEAQKRVEYKTMRVSEYPPVGDQLDIILKQLQSDRGEGKVLLPETVTLLDLITDIKVRYPKP